MKCPIDCGELAPHTYEANVEVEKCITCGGMWLDENELERIQDVREHNYSDEIQRLPDLVGRAYAMALAGSKPEVKCPKCQRMMERREHGDCSQVLIDVCPQCRGIWLDSGELRALEVFFEKASFETQEVRQGFFSRLTSLFR